MTTDRSIGSPRRPRVHFTSERGWLNDPNGLAFSAGEFHLFYQHNPQADVWGPMHWGHAVSPDLVRWEHLPIALAPDSLGWAFSGSAVVDSLDTSGFGAGSLVAIFTLASESRQAQGLAVSLDRGRTWALYDGNPVLAPPPNEPDFRDPKVIWFGDERDGHWVMVVAAGSRLLLYVSHDLRHWEPASQIRPDFASPVVWETPDLFPLTVEGTNERRWVISLSAVSGAPGGRGGSAYLVGDFDGREFRAQAPLAWVDHGPDFYAPQVWNHHPRDEVVWIAWMSDWSYAERVPSAGWRGVLSIPRELGLRRTDGRYLLTQRPIAALDEVLLPVDTLGSGTLSSSEVVDVLGRTEPDCFDLTIDLDVGRSDADAALEIRITSGDDEWSSITCSPALGEVALHRNRSGPDSFHRDEPSTFRARTSTRNEVVRLRVVVDTCSIELFVDEVVAISALAFPSFRERDGFAVELRATNGEISYRTVAVRA